MVTYERQSDCLVVRRGCGLHGDILVSPLGFGPKALVGNRVYVRVLPWGRVVEGASVISARMTYQPFR